MRYATDDTIVAMATAAGHGARGIVRLSGPETCAVLARCFCCDGDQQALLSAAGPPRRLGGTVHVAGGVDWPPLSIAAEALVWPGSRSYTRQPAAELHLVGSPPLLAAVVDQLLRAGARLAEPGEFTLRSFLAGRIDLTQAEAVLGVVDARGKADLETALDQLAGGLSRPLHQLRSELLAVLAHLEAGLDFVEEDIEFISRDELRGQLEHAAHVVASSLEQISRRDARTEAPRVALVGPPNAGKSSLYNALVQKYGDRATVALVSPEPGVTRDWIVAHLQVRGVEFELIDTAGEDSAACETGAAAQAARAAIFRQADLRVHCIDTAGAISETTPQVATGEDVQVLTKSDLSPAPAPVLPSVGGAVRTSCSSRTGVGIDGLADLLADRVAQLDGEHAASGASAITASRCTQSLENAQAALAAALDMARTGSDDLVAAELRIALEALGSVVGAVYADDLLDVIFSKFCIGK